MTTSPAARFALLSVTDKTGIVAFAQGLAQEGFQLISTGGTAKLLKDHHLKVIEASEFTCHPECLDGRVKTLHPKIHGGLLADRSNPDHLKDMARLNFSNIDVVAVNLYDFAGQAAGKNLPIHKVIEYIDVGGPTMLRASAKNHAHVYVVIDPNDYQSVLNSIKSNINPKELRQKLALKVFEATAKYDSMIAEEIAAQIHAPALNETAEQTLPEYVQLSLTSVQPLRYGENSHQKAGLYATSGQHHGLAGAKIIQGKELSYNNLIDLDAAAAIVADLSPTPAVTIIKHTNPCGTAARTGLNARELFALALKSDPKCAFGGIVAANLPIDGEAAQALAEIFLECVIAPAFTSEALQVLSAKKNLRVVQSNVVLPSGQTDQWTLKSIAGAVLIQTPDRAPIKSLDWKCVSNLKPSPSQLAELEFAMTLSRHVKSNAIVLTKLGQSIGVGAGQMSRVDAAKIALEKARELGHSPCGAVVASDAFFPFRDTVDLLANAGVSAIAHPGGSMRDQESIDAANEHGIIMVTTGMRHFKH